MVSHDTKESHGPTYYVYIYQLLKHKPKTKILQFVVPIASVLDGKETENDRAEAPNPELDAAYAQLLKVDKVLPSDQRLASLKLT